MKPNHRELPPPWRLISKLPGVDVWWMGDYGALRPVACIMRADDDFLYYHPNADMVITRAAEEEFENDPRLKGIREFLDTYHKLNS